MSKNIFIKIREKATLSKIKMKKINLSRRGSRDSTSRDSTGSTPEIPVLPCPAMFSQFLESTEDQRDFREFLEIIGLPDLTSYVDFIIQVHSLHNPSVCEAEFIEKCLIIYHRHVRSYATEKVNLDWQIKTKIEMKIQNQSFDSTLFDNAFQTSAQKILKFLTHFYEKR